MLLMVAVSTCNLMKQNYSQARTGCLSDIRNFLSKSKESYIGDFF
jgi:hypothetical protein